MFVVHKYRLPITDFTNIDMPVGAEILHVEAQGGHPCVWALIDPEVSEWTTRRFRLAGTGHPICLERHELRYIDTLMLHDKFLVLHLFEILP